MNGDGYHRVLFKLVGTRSNRAAIGARVTVRAADVQQFDEVRGGASYLSQNDLRLHFGLGTASKMESVQIRWPNGNVEQLQDVADTVPKGLKWKLRANVGDRVRWYELPEEVDH